VRRVIVRKATSGEVPGRNSYESGAEVTFERGRRDAERVEERAVVRERIERRDGHAEMVREQPAHLGHGEAFGDRDEIEPAHPARERAQQRRHARAEPERVLAGLDAAIEPHEPREHLEAERALHQPDAHHLVGDLVQRLAALNEDDAPLVRRETRPRAGTGARRPRAPRRAAAASPSGAGEMGAAVRSSVCEARASP
jgi:hypothetical protein